MENLLLQSMAGEFEGGFGAFGWIFNVLPIFVVVVFVVVGASMVIMVIKSTMSEQAAKTGDAAEKPTVERATEAAPQKEAPCYCDQCGSFIPKDATKCNSCGAPRKN